MEGKGGGEKKGKKLSLQTIAGQEKKSRGVLKSVRYKIYSYFLL